jgi:cation/acetate symporter
VSVVRHGSASEHEQLRVARLSTVLLGILSIALGIAFKGQNVAYMVGLAFAIAASANFPALVLSIFWRRFTTRGAQLSMFAGTASSLVLIALSPAIMVDLLHQPAAIVPLKNPGIISIPLSFAVAIITTVLLPEPESERKYAEVAERVHLGEKI